MCGDSARVENGTHKGCRYINNRILALFTVLGLTTLLAACSSYAPGGLRIDRSIQAKSQDSRVELVVLHYTAADRAQSLKILSEQNVSSHYLITDDAVPHVYQLVGEDRRAWHAGISQWYGRNNLNAASIGIEIVNQGPEGVHWAAYTPAQISTVITLLRGIIQRHQIKPYNVVGHSDIAPQRKTDPGPAFPWKQLAQAGIGRWYDEAQAGLYKRQFEREGLPDVCWFQKELERLGYQTSTSGVLDLATKNVIAAFQMHYRPSRYDGMPDAETAAILKALP
ncbi:N-acetylmuramoyl-L-alanine amidase [Paralcaligenes ureilyticus]|uniref:N-acetylmuramoyl-L-alanine amidase n=2 Tax=Paralcaligenes ureilyticus TaxID=627131 RepID=A0A4R3M554_9BURK|nr:N-acetylmuramoyl-L-alanine amidase [Paralcaligenes ureilyticus]